MSVTLPRDSQICCQSIGIDSQKPWPTLIKSERAFGLAAPGFLRDGTPDLRQGKHVVVVVVSEREPSARHWIITAYMARKLAREGIEWERV